MTNDPTISPKARSTSLAGRISPISDEMTKEMPYDNMVFDQKGTVMCENQIVGMREKLGLCTTCKGTPVKLFEVRKTKLNPLWKSREPLTIPNECCNGICLKCHPNLDTTTGLGSSRTGYTMLDTSTTSADATVTVTRLTNSGAESMCDPMVESELSDSSIEKLAASNKLKESMENMGSLKTDSSKSHKPMQYNSTQAKDAFPMPGIPVNPVDSFNSSMPKNSPAGILTSEKIDFLSMSRRGSVPILHAPFKYPAPMNGPPEQIVPFQDKTRLGDKQSTQKMDRLRAAYQRSFSQMSMDEISALTLDLHDSCSSFQMSGRDTNDSDSLLDEFSVPDFSMGTGDAIKSHRPQNPKAKSSKKKQSTKNLIADRIVPLQPPPDTQRIFDKQGKPTGAPLSSPPPSIEPTTARRSSSQNLLDHELPDLDKLANLKPKAKSATAGRAKMDNTASRKYMQMKSNVSAIPGLQLDLDGPTSLIPTDQQIERLPSHEEGSSDLAPPIPRWNARNRR